MPGHQGQSLIPVPQMNPQMLRFVHGHPGQPVPQQRIPHPGFTHEATGFVLQQPGKHTREYSFSSSSYITREFCNHLKIVFE